MLEFLASRPDGRATVDEFLKELKALKSRQSSEQFSDLDRVDALHAGLMVQENDGLRITEAGRSVLRAVEAFSNSSPDTEGFERSQSLNKIAELSDAEMRQKIFGVELRDADDSPARESLHEEAEIDQIVQPDPESPFGNRIEAEVAQTVGQSADERRDTNPLPVLAPSFKQFLRPIDDRCFQSEAAWRHPEGSHRAGSTKHPNRSTRRRSRRPRSIGSRAACDHHLCRYIYRGRPDQIIEV